MECGRERLLVFEAGPAIDRFISALDHLGVPYYIGGSIASIIYGEIRTTRDVDFVAALTADQVEPLIADLQAEFYADQISAARSVEVGDCFNVIHLSSAFQLDVFTPRPSPWVEMQFQRRRSERLEMLHPPREVFFASPEDIVLNKLIGFRLGNGASSVQWRDLQGVLKVQGRVLDRGYLEDWANRLDVEDLLNRALTDAGI